MAEQLITVWFSDEDECYFATTSEFPRISAFGDTPEEARRELDLVVEAAREILAEAKADG